eukprot:TRINITY_DN612_c0_g1_i1.p1 TRINITY_DN612_c0_g1~~TRINITY_DN612_c0_g1_i1.p1  ORF type:complete len:234 (+),score=114.72 TRINITY_DN612_c0_g1_i1:74-775(+)
MFSWITGGTAETQAVPVSRAVPAPKSQADYDQLFDKCVADFLAAADVDPNDETWNLIDEEQGISLFDKIIPDSPAHLTRAVGEFNAPVDVIAKLVAETNVIARNVWDTEIVVYNVIKSFNENYSLILQGFRAPFPVSSRDFSAVRCKKVIGDRIIICGTSVITDEIPEVEGYVRGDVLVSGFLIEPVVGKPGVSRVIGVTQLDPKGWIPTAAVNSTKRRHLERFLLIRQASTK